MATVRFKCDRCGAKFSGKDEYSAEMKFNDHTCENMKPLSELPLPILRQLAMGEISEKEAWEMV